MRDVGLLDVTTEVRSGVGRPQHLYSLAAGAPSLGLEPPTFPLLGNVFWPHAELVTTRSTPMTLRRSKGDRFSMFCLPVFQRPLRWLL